MAIIDAYGEWDDYVFTNCSIGNGVTIVTNNTGYRNANNSGFAYARCAISFVYTANAWGIRMWGTPMTSAWFSSRIVFSTNFGLGGDEIDFLSFVDSNGIPRLQIAPVSSTSTSSFNIFKIDASGTQTLLGTTTNGFSYQSNSPDKIDVFFNYNTSGSIQVYSNGALIFTYTGDITTDGITQLAGTRHRSWGTFGMTVLFSENVVSDSDTRNISLITNVAAGEGTLDQWTGTYTNVNQVSDTSDNSYDVASASGDTQRYTMSSIPVANYTVLAKVTNIRATQGSGTLTHLALAENIGGTGYTTSAVVMPDTFGPVQFIQEVNPATGVAWTVSDLNDVTRESGYQATT